MSGASESLRVGERNAKAVKQSLDEYHIKLLAEDCGLNYGEQLEFYSENGNYIIKAVGKPPKII